MIRIPRVVAALPFLLVGSLLTAQEARVQRVIANDNRVPAGRLVNGALTLQLEAREGEWRPDSDDGAGVVIRAFAERGKSLSNPGPLIRVPEGTTIAVAITNHLTERLVVRGLGTRPSARGAAPVEIPPGETREARFLAGAPGTYYYQASTGTRAERVPVDGGLTGAFIVDPAGSAARANERVLVLSLWNNGPADSVAQRVARFAINGKSWPSTERLTYALGDTVRFRVVNTTPAVHPMHLHGFYFDVNGRGDGSFDSVAAPGVPHGRVVTERLAAGRTTSITWVPERGGNWLFHCHDNVHITRNDPLDGSPLPPEHRAHLRNHNEMMGGLVMGIAIRDPRGRSTRTAAAATRQLRLIAQVDSGSTEDVPAYGFTLHERGRASTSTGPLLPGPLLVLKRNEPVAITVVNRLPEEPTAVHWHGLELESYYDGVPDFSGSGSNLMRAIAPGDSFVAHFTPPRSGTFMYHPHADEVRQHEAGLTGMIVVVDDPARFDPTHDLPFLLSVPRYASERGGGIYVNGSLKPPPRDLRVGERYRLRIANVHTSRPSMIARLMRDSTVLSWEMVAKDGMDLPPARRTSRAAQQQLGNGEIYDFEFVPVAPGDLRFTVTAGNGQPLNEVLLRVR